MHHHSSGRHGGPGVRGWPTPNGIAGSPACSVAASGWPQRPGQDTADQPWSSTSISLPGCSTLQEVHFVESVGRLYLSCTACKGLGLVHSGFPHPKASVAAAGMTGDRPDRPPARPPSLPLPPLEENIPRLEEWLLGQFSSTTFNTNRNPLPVMEGASHHIHQLEGAKPHACHTPASVPKHWRAEVKQQLDEDVKRGVIRPVPAGEATEWCARMVVVAKKSGKQCRTVDFQKLNAWCC